MAGMHPDRRRLAGQARRDRRPLRRLLPVRLWQFHRGDRDPGRQDAHLHVLDPRGQAGRAGARTSRGRDQGERSKAVPDGQVCLPVVHGQGDNRGKKEECFEDEDNMCFQAAGLEPLKVILKKLGGWPLLEGPAWNEEGYKW